MRLPKLNTSIENVYRLCYPQEIPNHLRLDNLRNILKSQGHQVTRIKTLGFSFYRFVIFEGFVEDLEKGLITSDLIGLLSIDLYNDLIEQAKELRKINTESLNRAACVLSRIVLQEGLNKICNKNGISLKTNKAHEANMALKKNSIYGTSQFKHIDTWLSIGNSAAHPKSTKLDFSSITETQMDDMIKNIPEFIGKYL